MTLHPLAGKPAPRSLLVDLRALESAYYRDAPDPGVPAQRVAFGTSGHRGSALRRSFNEAHIAAITQAVCEYRAAQGITGPLFLGMDTHALSAPARRTALEVLCARGVTVMTTDAETYTPTPVVSHAILAANRTGTGAHGRAHADGMVITPSHNPPEDGGIKYDPPHGGPADTDVTRWIEDRANELLARGLGAIRRVPYETAWRTATVHVHDFLGPYTEDLGSVLDLAVVRDARIRLGADPLGGATVGCWGRIAERWGLDITVVNPLVDKTFGFMPLDHDGKIRMDCSSPYAMAGLVALRDRFDLAFGNDTDADRHGIVTPSAGLMNPNHYLSVAIDHLFRTRTRWRADAAVGKTLVTSGMVDRVTARLGRRLAEVPVGFKYFVQGLLEGSYGFGGEESAGAAFLRHDGTVWTTDKDGLLMDLLAAEILAVTGRDPAAYYSSLTEAFGTPAYTRIDQPATPEQKARLKKLSPAAVTADTLAGETVTRTLTRAPEGDAELGGLKVETASGWFAARPSGTEDVYKVYAESFRGEDHLARIVDEARALVTRALGT